MAEPLQIQQVDAEQFKKTFGEKEFEAAIKIAAILRDRLSGDRGFTGTIGFDVNCRNGGIGNINAYVRKNI